MLMKFVFCDAETMSLREDGIVLDMSFLFVDFNKRLDYTAKELVNNGVKFKFDVMEQKEKGRHVSNETISFWENQSPEVRKRCVLPSKHDVSFYDLPSMVDQYLKSQKVFSNKDFYLISRGGLDEKLLFRLYYDLNIDENSKFYRYNMYRDVRTALHFLIGAETGWFNLGDEIKDLDKHDSLHDCVMDALMIQKALGMAL